MQKAIYLNDNGTKMAGFSIPTDSPRDMTIMISELGVDSNVLEGITEIKAFRDLSNEAIRSFERTAEDEQAAATEVTPGRMTTIKVYRINDMWFAEASGFDYAGAGETPQEAIDDLLTEIGKGGFEWE